jgi:hypothetical protein
MDLVKTDSLSDPAQIATPITDNLIYNIEFFHIYTDEHIGAVHEASLQYLRQAQQAWRFNAPTIVMIDNYNPTHHILTANEILQHLESEGALPAYWAFEADLVENAELLMNNLTSTKLQKNYRRYVEQHNKFPCSLLTATWYLTRLGALPFADIIQTTGEEGYKPASRLINILPEDYKSIEVRAQKLIANSKFAEQVHNIQDLFYPMNSGRKISLW